MPYFRSIRCHVDIRVTVTACYWSRRRYCLNHCREHEVLQPSKKRNCSQSPWCAYAHCSQIEPTLFSVEFTIWAAVLRQARKTPVVNSARYTRYINTLPISSVLPSDYLPSVGGLFIFQCVVKHCQLVPKCYGTESFSPDGSDAPVEILGLR